MLEDERREKKVLVVAEDRSVTALRTAPNDYNDLILVAQQGKRSDTFARRAIQRIDRLTRTGWRPRVAILAVSAAAGSAAFGTRALIARALIACLDGADSELVIVGHTGFSARARHELFALVQTLNEAAPKLHVRVDLSNGPATKTPRIAPTASRVRASGPRLLRAS
jgi:hypothetical protein